MSTVLKSHKKKKKTAPEHLLIKYIKLMTCTEQTIEVIEAFFGNLLIPKY